MKPEAMTSVVGFPVVHEAQQRIAERGRMPDPVKIFVPRPHVGSSLILPIEEDVDRVGVGEPKDFVDLIYDKPPWSGSRNDAGN